MSFIEMLRSTIIKLVLVSLNGRRLKIGSGVMFLGLPRVRVDKGSRLEFGDNVFLGDLVEIRVTKRSRVLIASDCKLDRGVRIVATNGATVEVGRHTRIGLWSVLNGGGGITVGRSVLISGYVYLQSSSHAFSDPKQTIQAQGYKHAQVVISDDCWLGAHCVILPGVSIGSRCVVGANAVVTVGYPPRTCIGGVPARSIRTLEATSDGQPLPFS